MFSSSEVSDWRSEGNALFYGSGVTVMGDKLVSNCNAMTEMTPALAVIVSRPLMTPPWTEGINWDTNVAICWPAVTSIVLLAMGSPKELLKETFSVPAELAMSATAVS